MDQEQEEKLWQEIKRINRFSHAFRGLYVFFKTTRNLKIHLIIAVLVIFAGFYFSVLNYEWLALIFVITLVLVSEAFNTAIEIDMDLTSPKYHPFARDTKDVAAGAVLISAITALLVGILIFGKYLLAL
ncbi:MAG: diacylglycerol kinase family protein [Gammaproteobacteria bacterium]